ncbi:MAG TPA: LamG domain-containing protein [Nodularia sp. (in: cyanobacteria)]|nr:LamG domain-containing protein [Nodularia sp. (in: cyanobacteria)]
MTASFRKVYEETYKNQLIEIYHFSQFAPGGVGSSHFYVIIDAYKLPRNFDRRSHNPYPFYPREDTGHQPNPEQSEALAAAKAYCDQRSPNHSNAADAVFDSQQLPHPIACWRFDQGISSETVVIRDRSGLEPQGTMIRGVTCQKRRFGYAGFFDGVDDLVEIPDQPIFHFTNQMTVTAWVKPLRLHGATYGLQTIVNKWYAMDSYILLIDKGNYSFAVAFPGGRWGWTVHVSAPATVDVWSHVAGVFNGEHIFLYLNGKLAAQAVAKGWLQDSNRPICIGNHPSWNAFRGLIEEVQLYDVALNASQIQESFSFFRRNLARVKNLLYFFF